ncbi:hypothetical protein ABB37_01473 [Leptomonas pyrrhocoris]|uniref:Uncharacterized protein n=1 Tax=Leptomonas pyrrhocoris TaxID=157538 RepID=A0A0N0DZA0_LEPPY|nr:hypothetical protein ABB37_01473 [Leptomonas pyrrhocoris]KPA85055.1 hypothetical protein ABB37_01473 [Leptomonas pyrrhocoris]|eukprot:XP_015663494.1 hypothetical protein ABB37_01473 [Leptomonas pyrrhocoris]
MTDDDADLELSLPAEEPAEVTTSYEDCSSSAASEKNVHSDSSSDAARPSDVVGAKGGFSPSFSFGANIAVKSDSVPTAVPSGGGGGLFGKGPNPFGAANAKEGDAKPFVFGAAFENNKNTAVATESAGIFGAVGGAARPFSSSSAKDGGGAAFSFGADSLKKGDRPAGAVPTRGAAGAVGSQPKHMDPANVKKDDDTPAKRSVEGNTTINEGVSGNAVAVDVAAPPPLNNDASAVVRTPDVLAPLFSLEDVHRVVSEALCEQREAMKAEWDAFRKDLLFDIRQAVSEASTRNVVGERADFEEPAAEMNESLVRRHLSKAFRKY